MLEGIGQIAKVWQRHQPTDHPLRALQEHVRRVTQLTSASTSDDLLLEAEDWELLRQALDQIDIIFRDEFDRNPNSLPNWHALRRITHSAPPVVNREYYFFGLLDICTQLAAFMDLDRIRPRLFNKLETVVFETEVVEFRLQAVRFINSVLYTDKRIPLTRLD